MAASNSHNQILRYRLADNSSHVNRSAFNEFNSPVLTIKQQNGKITVQSEVKSNDLQLSETTLDLQRMLNLS